MKLAAAGLFVLMGCAPSAAQDVEFMRALERAQASKPARLTSVARIAPESEPGTPLLIQGRVYREDGSTPAAGITVFAYQTDRYGVYDVPSAGPHSWRLKGWAITDAEGRFEFRTIRPASYPNSTIAQHVHVNLLEPPGTYRLSTEVQFADDPKLTAREKDASAQAGNFGTVRPVTRRNGVDHVEINIRMERRGPN